MNNRTEGNGRRFDNGKLRYDLLPVDALERCAQVFTFGAKKYGDRNWERGMKWSRVLGSLERHLQEIKKGNDFDKESGLLHIDHVTANALFLSQYYKIFPEGDDRPKNYLEYPRIGLDVDEVLADFIGYYQTYFNEKINIESWNFDPKIKERLIELSDNHDFWLNLPIKTKPNDIPFEPACYISSRSCPKEITEKWLHKNGFSNSPVYHVGDDGSKVEIAKKYVDWFVDDRFKNFVELSKAGVCCFLFSAPHNYRYDVGFKRIKTLSELALFNA